MLSYQHAYHAGGPADVHKHALLWWVLTSLASKPKPFCAIDLHAGEGVYDLEAPNAQKTGEFQSGIAALMARPDTCAELHGYRALVRGSNPDGPLKRYPGSCAIMLAALRADDRLIVNELHPSAAQALRRWAGRDQRIAVHHRDAAEALVALVPPHIRRGVMLIDPSYEVKAEYTELATALTAAVRKWREGVFVIWYPILSDDRHRPLTDACAGVDLPCATSEILFDAPGLADAPEKGLRGSGVAVINPPWGFGDATPAIGDELAECLARGPHSRHDLRWLRPDR